MQLYDLDTRYDSRASFYGKARIQVDDDGTKHLWSYSTRVACIHPITEDDLDRKHETGEFDVLVFGTYSQTTLRHIKEFLKQNGFRADNGKQILADYGATEHLS